jgi:hypothetical protein
LWPLLFLDESPTDQVGIGVGFDLIVLHATDGAVDFQYSERHIVYVGDSVLALGTFLFVHADVFAGHVRLDGLSIVNKQTRFTLHEAPESAVGAGERTNAVVQQ